MQKNTKRSWCSFGTKVSWSYVMDRNLENRTIILDIDGVLMADGEKTLSQEIIEYVTTLKLHNDVVIISNNFSDKRCEYTSKTLGVPWINTPYKKPSTRIMKYLKYDTTKPLIMIGDKVLTDGIFAKRIDAEAIMLTRRTNVDDRTIIVLTYIIDDAFYSLVRFFCKAQ
ncbi:hypothetical protein COB80_00630 [Candidatus Kaiserbacteria bacterium]|nr:MAG: hypothetical protein COB80_00630 [Candidatus Kaiserbacteria bacterium]